MKKEEVKALIAETKKALEKNTEKDDTIFPWEHVFESMLEYPDRVTVNDGKEQAETTKGQIGKEMQNAPAFVTMGGQHEAPTIQKCPTCGHYTVGLWFSSPAWTWEHLCGRAGHMTICSHCGKQLSMDTCIMN